LDDFGLTPVEQRGLLDFTREPRGLTAFVTLSDVYDK